MNQNEISPIVFENAQFVNEDIENVNEFIDPVTGAVAIGGILGIQALNELYHDYLQKCAKKCHTGLTKSKVCLDQCKLNGAQTTLDKAKSSLAIAKKQGKTKKAARLQKAIVKAQAKVNKLAGKLKASKGKTSDISGMKQSHRATYGSGEKYSLNYR